MKKFAAFILGIALVVVPFYAYTTIQDRNTEITDLAAQLDEAKEIERLF